MQIIYSPTFRKQYRHLTREAEALAEEKEAVFRNNPFDARLKTHKLHGRLSDLWSFSLNMKLRIVFEFGEKQSVIFHAIGPHDIYE
jgi:mRNA-degrading endonuclease YafQ of YafQ-DinJ toxin-antitoxin module